MSNPDPFQIYNSQNNSFDLNHGFLPEQDPLPNLPPQFSVWEEQAKQLPKLMVSDNLRFFLENLPEFPVQHLSTYAEYERAMLILSYFGHAYIWSNHQTPATKIPAKIAIPWYYVAEKLQRPPILSYASYALYNWQRIEKDKPIALGNLALLQNFLGGIDEEWFILVHVDIEKKAITALQALQPTQNAVIEDDHEIILENLQKIQFSLMEMGNTLKRMPENCDPYIYYHRVRPYIHGWKENPALPAGVIYEGVAAYQDKPIKFKGETGAQSAIIPTLDAAFCIAHKANPLKTHLLEMRTYMPSSHRLFLNTIEQGPKLRDFIKSNYPRHPKLRFHYNECIKLIFEFRSIHLQFAAHYIQKQNQSSPGNPTDIGTGGTPFMNYLRKHKHETKKHLL